MDRTDIDSATLRERTKWEEDMSILQNNKVIKKFMMRRYKKKLKNISEQYFNEDYKKILSKYRLFAYIQYIISRLNIISNNISKPLINPIKKCTELANYIIKIFVPSAKVFLNILFNYFIEDNEYKLDLKDTKFVGKGGVGSVVCKDILCIKRFGRHDNTIAELINELDILIKLQKYNNANINKIATEWWTECKDILNESDISFITNYRKVKDRNIFYNNIRSIITKIENINKKYSNNTCFLVVYDYLIKNKDHGNAIIMENNGGTSLDIIIKNDKLTFNVIITILNNIKSHLIDCIDIYHKCREDEAGVDDEEDKDYTKINYHYDIKPGNILYSERNKKIYIIDVSGTSGGTPGFSINIDAEHTDIDMNFNHDYLSIAITYIAIYTKEEQIWETKYCKPDLWKGIEGWIKEDDIFISKINDNKYLLQICKFLFTDINNYKNIYNRNFKSILQNIHNFLTEGEDFINDTGKDLEFKRLLEILNSISSTGTIEEEPKSMGAVMKNTNRNKRKKSKRNKRKKRKTRKTKKH